MSIHQPKDYKAALALIAELEAKNAALAAAGQRKAVIKHSDKGCITISGIRGKYGAAFYPNEWEFLFANKEAIEAYAEEHKAELAALSAATRAANGKS